MWVLEGIVVGVGAILPGVSGGTLCYAFGIYEPLLEVLSDPLRSIKKHIKMILFFALGGAIGFVGFAGITNYLLVRFEGAVLCAFVGLIAGTLPQLWREAGRDKKDKGKGRGAAPIIALAISFALISIAFYVFKSVWQLTIPPTFLGYMACGLLWGLSFIIPGFSSSTLLLFFGIYEKMSEGISRLSLSVLIPLGIAMLATLLLLSRVMKTVFEKYHDIASHCVLGFVIATTLMILPSFSVPIGTLAVYAVCIVIGAVASFFFSMACDRIRKENE